MTYKGRIEYTIKETHPDKDCVVGGWNPDKVYDYEDIYTIDPDKFYDTDHIINYIKTDLALVAGGGYNWDHIDNIRFEMEVIA